MWFFEMIGEMFRDLPEMFRDWPIGTFLAIILTGIMALMAVFVLAGIFWVADSWFRPMERGNGQIVGKTFTPAHTTTTLVSTGKVTVPVTNYHPDDWTVTVHVGDKADSISVTKEYYDLVSQGTKVDAEYVSGRISGDMYLRVIR